MYCDNQAFSVGKNVYGLQFHLKVTPVMIERWMNYYWNWNEPVQNLYICPDNIRSETHFNSQASNYYGARIFSKFIRCVSAPRRHREERPQVKR